MENIQDVRVMLERLETRLYLKAEYMEKELRRLKRRMPVIMAINGIIIITMAVITYVIARSVYGG
jgi:hypothetical protein